MEYTNKNIFIHNEASYICKMRYLSGDNLSVVLFKPDCFYKYSNGKILYEIIRPIFNDYIQKNKMEVAIEAWIDTSHRKIVASYTRLHYADLLEKYGSSNSWLQEGLQYIQNVDKGYAFPILFLFLVVPRTSEKSIKQFVDFYFRVNSKLKKHEKLEVFAESEYLTTLINIKEHHINRKDNLIHASDDIPINATSQSSAA